MDEPHLASNHNWIVQLVQLWSDSAFKDSCLTTCIDLPVGEHLSFLSFSLPLLGISPSALIFHLWHSPAFAWKVNHNRLMPVLFLIRFSSSLVSEILEKIQGFWIAWTPIVISLGFSLCNRLANFENGKTMLWGRRGRKIVERAMCNLLKAIILFAHMLYKLQSGHCFQHGWRTITATPWQRRPKHIAKGQEMWGTCLKKNNHHHTKIISSQRLVSFFKVKPCFPSWGENIHRFDILNASTWGQDSLSWWEFVLVLSRKFPTTTITLILPGL